MNGAEVQARMPMPSDSLLGQSLWLLGFAGEPVLAPAPGLEAFVRHHGVAALLDAGRLAQLPEERAASLKTEQKRVVLRALKLTGALRQLSRRLSAANIDYLALKGPALARQVHGDCAARAAIDLDILVRPEHWPAALEVLAGLGYLTPERPAALPSGTHELLLRHPDGLPCVELHRRLLRRRHALLGDDWSRPGASVDLQGQAVATLAPAIGLPYLAAHAGQHLFRRLIWLLDILALLRLPGFDAAQAARIARQADLEGPLGVCLALLERLFGFVPPAELAALTKLGRAQEIMFEQALLALQGCHSDAQVAQSLGMARRVWLDLCLQRTLAGRLQSLCDWFSPTGKDLAWVRLPRAAAFLYPLVRLARLVSRER